MRNTIDMTPFARTTIGFDRLLDQLGTLADPDAGDNYPPYNIEKLGEDQYRVNLAVAGFRESELTITVEANQLIISGKKEDTDEKPILYRGIAHRPFVRRFSLADFVVVKNAKLSNGLLTIQLERQLPEAMKPRPIIINGALPRTEVRNAA